MDAESKRVIAVVGATGANGGSVVRHLSTLNSYLVGAITRDVSRPNAQKLAQLPNVEVVAANISDRSSLALAFKGAEAVFAITNYYDRENVGNTLNEARQGCIMADVAAEQAVDLFIWCNVRSPVIRTGAEFPGSPITENKFVVSQYLKFKGYKHVDLYVGVFMDNWLQGTTVLDKKSNGETTSFSVKDLAGSGKVVHGSLNRAADGVLELEQPLFLPHAKQGMSWIERDVGPVVASLLDQYRQRPEILDDAVYCVVDHYSMNDVVEEIKRQTGEAVRHIIPPSSGVQDLDQLYGYANKWGLLTDVEFPHPNTASLGYRLHTLEDFVREAVLPYIQCLE
ncbi:hypothetical protein E8E14_010441 [Neopestalotiopsis sp. 37M]|nr:hypothetical protein E8E14_010441 [Neopestalotiopsis sp. 37M]